ETHLRRSVEAAEKSSPITHRWLGQAKMALARFLFRQQRLREAESLLRQVVALRDVQVHPDPLQQDYAEGLLGLTAFADGRWDEARQKLEAHGEMVVLRSGDGSPEAQAVHEARAALGLVPLDGSRS
ncbi:MAG: hypothetical protein AAGE94_02040, partial [Acidobacteriota bacterium]